MIAACSEDTVQQGSSSDDEIQLVPVTRSGVPPGHSVRVEGLFSPLFGVINPCLTLSASSAPSFNRALEDGFGQRIVTIHMAKPCKLAAFYNGYQWLLLACKGVSPLSSPYCHPYSPPPPKFIILETFRVSLSDYSEQTRQKR
ncbi:hypothetical protein ACOMHN_008537 [Nucella lapillus]